ncbi:MAG: stage III sporulation protein AE [Bacillota bacterium]
MKKAFVILIALLFAFVVIKGESIANFIETTVISNDCIVAYADSTEESIMDEVEDSIEKLIGSEVDDLFDSIESDEKYEFGSSIKDYIESIVAGEIPSITDFISIALNSFFSNFITVISGLISIVIIALLYNLSQSLLSGFQREGVQNVIYYAVFGAIITILCVMISDIVTEVKSAITVIANITDIFIPILVTIMTAIGSVSSISIFQPMLVLINSVAIQVVDSVVIPLFLASVVFSMVGSMSTSVKLDKLNAAIRSIAGWILGIMFTVIIGLLTSEGIVGASIDSISIRSAKFAISSYVPILGGYLTDGFDVLLAGAVLVKNAFGLTGIILLFVSVLQPIATVVAFNIGLKLTAGIIEPMSDSRISNLLANLAKSLNIIIAVILGLTFLVFSMFMLIIATCNMGLG